MKRSFLILIMILQCCKTQAQNGHTCTSRDLEERIISDIGNFMRMNEQYVLSFHKDYKYENTAWVKYSQKELTYYVNVISFDTNNCSFEIGFTGNIDNRNPLDDHLLRNRFYKDITHILIKDSRKILITFSNDINIDIINNLSSIKKLKLHDYIYYTNLYGKVIMKGLYELRGINIYKYSNLQKEVIEIYKNILPDGEMLDKFIFYK